jgi:hypothetical protein
VAGREDAEERETPPVEGPEEMRLEAEADEALKPGSEPGGPEWPEDATEGRGESPSLGPEHGAD